jgi:hypothetical protein
MARGCREHVVLARRHSWEYPGVTSNETLLFKIDLRQADFAYRVITIIVMSIGTFIFRSVSLLFGVICTTWLSRDLHPSSAARPQLALSPFSGTMELRNATLDDVDQVRQPWSRRLS